MRNKIILLGYMGSGKSTIAKLLAQKTGLVHLDLDQLIESQESLSVSDIFTQKGEIYFRKVEHELFKALMTNPDDFVLSLGGGTPCYANNHELLNGANIISIYLKASIDELTRRLIRNKAKRPLIAQQSNEEIMEFIAKHLFERSFFYNQATHILTVDSKNPDQVVAEIEQLLV